MTKKRPNPKLETNCTNRSAPLSAPLNDAVDLIPSSSSRAAVPLAEEHRLLIIDDDEVVLRALKTALKRRVSKVFIARNAEETRTILDIYPVNIVVCDYDLGRSSPNGVELIRQLKKAYSCIKRTVIYSGVDPREIEKTGDIDDILNKSTDLHKLRMVIQKPFD